MDQEGLSALLFNLLRENLDDFEPIKMPPNDFGFDMKMRAARSVEKYLFEALKEGRFNLATCAKTGERCLHPCEKIYAYYKDWCEHEGLRRAPSSEFGKRLKKLLSIEKSRRSIDGIREGWYEFSSFEECRKGFEKFTKQSD
jgi:phage/plasmid-associated DNA primase